MTNYYENKAISSQNISRYFVWLQPAIISPALYSHKNLCSFFVFALTSDNLSDAVIKSFSFIKISLIKFIRWYSFLYLNVECYAKLSVGIYRQHHILPSVGIVGPAYWSQRKVAWCRADQWSNATTMLPSNSQKPLMEQQLQTLAESVQ